VYLVVAHSANHPHRFKSSFISNIVIGKQYFPSTMLSPSIAIFSTSTHDPSVSDFPADSDFPAEQLEPNNAVEITPHVATNLIDFFIIHFLSPFHGCGQKPTQSRIRHNTFCKDLFACTEIAHHHFLSLYK
jgi:hypothetical protein